MINPTVFILVLVIALMIAAIIEWHKLRWLRIDGHRIPVKFHKSSSGGWYFETYEPLNKGDHVVMYDVPPHPDTRIDEIYVPYVNGEEVET